MLLYQNEGFRSGTSSHRGEVAVVIVVVSLLRLFWFLSPGASKRRGVSLSFTKMNDRLPSQDRFFQPSSSFRPRHRLQSISTVVSSPIQRTYEDAELQSSILPSPVLFPTLR